jgi:hypothetical protein
MKNMENKNSEAKGALHLKYSVNGVWEVYINLGSGTVSN